MRSGLLLALVFLALPFVLANPVFGIYMWSWMSYMNPHRLTWGVAYDFPFAAVIGGVTLVAWLLSKEPKFPPKSGLTTMLVIWVLWITLTSANAVVPDFAWTEWNRAVKILLMSLVAGALLRDLKRIRVMIWVIALSIGFYGIKGGFWVLLVRDTGELLGPPGSFIAENNSLALALVMVLPLMYFLFLHASKPIVRKILLVCGGLTVVAVLGSLSRGAYLGLAAMMIPFLLKSRHRTLALFMLAVFAGVGAWSLSGELEDRVQSISEYQQDSSAQQRLKSWRFAVDQANQHPLTGGGYGVFRLNTYTDEWAWLGGGTSSYHNAHSIYFEVLGSQGYIGLLIFLSLGFMTYRYAQKITQLVRDKPEQKWIYDLASMLQVSLVGYAVAGAFLNMAFFDLPYHIMVLVIVLREQVLKMQATALPDTDDPQTEAALRETRQ